MEKGKQDILRLALQPYTIELLHKLEKEPARFKDLNKQIPNEMTLSNKLRKLLEYGLIEIVPIKIGRHYANCYTISVKGKRLLTLLKQVGQLE